MVTTISVNEEVKKLPEEIKGDRDWNTFLKELVEEYGKNPTGWYILLGHYRDAFLILVGLPHTQDARGKWYLFLYSSPYVLYPLQAERIENLEERIKSLGIPKGRIRVVPKEYRDDILKTIMEKGYLPVNVVDALQIVYLQLLSVHQPEIEEIIKEGSRPSIFIGPSVGNNDEGFPIEILSPETREVVDSILVKLEEQDYVM